MGTRGAQKRSGMKRRARIGLSALGLVLGALAPAQPGAAAPPTSSQTGHRPNVVLIVLDDMGYSDIGAFGSEIRTPNIDALAAQGLRYARFDSKAVCSPTRAALLTGRNPQTVRMADLPAHVLDPNDFTRDRGELAQNASTIAQVLQRAGYATHGYGKWHLAPETEDGSPGNNDCWPLQRGFDDFYGFFVNRRSIGTPYRRAKGTPLLRCWVVDAGRGFRAAGGVGRA